MSHTDSKDLKDPYPPLQGIMVCVIGNADIFEIFNIRVKEK